MLPNRERNKGIRLLQNESEKLKYEAETIKRDWIRT